MVFKELDDIYYIRWDSDVEWNWKGGESAATLITQIYTKYELFYCT
jgi:hypothetical protein